MESEKEAWKVLFFIKCLSYTLEVVFLYQAAVFLLSIGIGIAGQYESNNGDNK